MTYHQMRRLFAGLARYDGRLSVLMARRESPDGTWTVVLRDHVRHTWLRLRRIEQLAADELESAPQVPWEHPLTEFEALAEPEGAAMTWVQVLWALTALEQSARGWSPVAIEASRPTRTEPRYRLVLLLQRLVGRSRKGCEPGRKPLDPGRDPLDRFYVDARTALARAQDEARAFNHHYIGTEHLLLGLLRTEHGVAARLLTAIGVDLAQTRRAVEALVGRGEATPPGPLPVTPRMKKVLELARQEAKRLRSTHVRSEHLLLGLGREGGGLAARILAEHRVGYEQLRGRVDRAALACPFCGRSGLDVARLVAGPGVYICEHCTEDASRLTDQGTSGASHDPLSVVADDQVTTCSFCGKHRPEVDRLIAGPGVLICSYSAGARR